LHNFAATSLSYPPYVNSDGDDPQARLILSGNTLYGTTTGGGSSGNGTVFAVNTDGTGFTTLYSFNDGSDGADPWAGLTLSGNTLYGTTTFDGSSGGGTVFSLSLLPPTIITPPQSQTAETESTINLTVDAISSQPLTYQWFFNGTNAVSGATTNSDLVLTNVQFSQSGAYTMVITNLFGTVTSAPVMLNVIAPVARRPVLGVQVMGEAGSLLYVDYLNPLSPVPNWTVLGPVSLTSTSQYCFDVTMPLPPARLYRARQTGTPGVVPSLNLNFFSAIMLTGNVGDSLRLDYINQFGPTNAWVTLNTITLTNTSQLYFDVSAIGQPPRLYQMVPVP
jgi:uncharacterized repeat protein (TIGR03803 family)